MSFQLLLRGLTLMQLLPPGTVPQEPRPAPEQTPSIAVVTPGQNPASPTKQTTTPLTASELKELRQIRNSLPAEFRPLSESKLFGDDTPFFHSPGSAATQPPAGHPRAESSEMQRWTSKIRDISERLDDTANQLEHERSYKTADELRKLSHELRLIARESMNLPLERTDEKAGKKADRLKP